MPRNDFLIKIVLNYQFLEIVMLNFVDNNYGTSEKGRWNPFFIAPGRDKNLSKTECESTEIPRTLNSLTTKSPWDTLEPQPLMATTPIIDVNLLINTQLLESTLSTASMMRIPHSV